MLIVYYSFTQQTAQRRRHDGRRRYGAADCDVTMAALEFTDPHYGTRFSKLPMSWPIAKIVGMLPAQGGGRRATSGSRPRRPAATTTWS